MFDGQQIVDRFAKALDNEDYVTAKSLLSADCEYACRGELYRGPDEIVSSYQGNGDAAKAFDNIRYESSVAEAEHDAFRIEFADHISHAGHEFTFRCHQLIQIDKAGKIAKIQHVELPGQLAALESFKRKVAAGR